MKILFVGLLSAVVLCSASLAQSGQLPANDPVVIVGGGMGSLPVGDTFLFGSPSGTSPGTSPCVVNGISEADCVFQNDTTSTFTSLAFDIDAVFPPNTELECGVLGGGPFSTCSIAFDFDGAFATFTGGPGVLPGGDFSIEVDDWSPGQDFGVGANGNTPPDSGSPEPGTVALLLTGMAGLLVALRRKTAVW